MGTASGSSQQWLLGIKGERRTKREATRSGVRSAHLMRDGPAFTVLSACSQATCASPANVIAHLGSRFSLQQTEGTAQSNVWATSGLPMFPNCLCSRQFKMKAGFFAHPVSQAHFGCQLSQ